MVQDVTEGVRKLQTRFDRFEQQQAQRPTVAMRDFCGQPQSGCPDGVSQRDNWEETGVYRPKSTQRSAGRGGPRVCFQCNMPGHFKRDCPYLYSHGYQGEVLSQPSCRRPVPNNWGDPNASADTQRLAAAEQYQARGVGTKKSSKKVYLKVKIHGQPQYCLLDSGSEISLIPSECVGKTRVLPTTKTVWAANGTVIPIAGWIELTACLLYTSPSPRDS